MGGLRRTQAGAAVPVAIVQKRTEAGAVVPVEFQGDFAEPGDITVALNAHISALDPHGDRAYALAQSLNPLGKYTRVVVVDGSGAGGYTTLSAAITAGAFSGASATNRFLVLLFGTVTEPASTNVAVPEGVDIAGWQGHRWVFSSASFGVIPAGNSSLFGVNIATGRVQNPPTGKTLKAIICTFQGLYLGGVGTIECTACSITSITVAAAGTANLRGGSMSSAISASASGGTITLDGVTWLSSVLCSISSAINLSLYHTRARGTVTGINLTGLGNTLTIVNSFVTNTTSSVDKSAVDVSSDVACTLKIDNSTISAPSSANGGGLIAGGLIVGGAMANAMITGSTFEGQAGLAINNIGDAWSNAPIYQCRFNGGVTGVTPAAGTVVGTCVSF